MSRSPRICVFGAGSVGCLIGGLLRPFADLVLIGRAPLRAEIARHGLHLTSWSGAELHLAPGELRYATSADAVRGADLVLVTVKSAATEAAARELAPLLGPGALVVSFQNGIRNTEVLRAALGAERVLAGMVPFNVVHRGNGVFHRASAGELHVDNDAALDPFACLFAKAGLPLVRRADMEAVQWGKLLLNLNNPINALSGLPLKAELGGRDYRSCLAMAQREALRLLDAAHIRAARLTPLPPHWLPPLLELPDGLFRRLASRMLAIDPVARSSMQDDLAAGRRTEIEVINGEIVRLADGLGVSAPVNARLVQLIMAAERGDARRWSGHELLAELRGAGEAGC